MGGFLIGAETPLQDRDRDNWGVKPYGMSGGRTPNYTSILYVRGSWSDTAKRILDQRHKPGLQVVYLRARDYPQAWAVFGDAADLCQACVTEPTSYSPKSEAPIRLIKRMAEATRESALPRPFGAVISGDAWDASRPPLPAEIRAATYLALSGGARALGVRSNGWPKEDPRTSGALAELRRLGREIEPLMPYLAAGDAVRWSACADKGVETGAVLYGREKLIVFAVSTDVRSGAVSGGAPARGQAPKSKVQLELRLPPGLAISGVTAFGNPGELLPFQRGPQSTFKFSLDTPDPTAVCMVALTAEDGKGPKP
jgi:hypothetical protein